ncbi:MAG: hypothetical protein EBU52_05790, partial [Cytophagia bacterium]|nr:hypothetical protein [Cytophagia bacterium]
TGTASININGTVGATTPSTGAFTTLSASSTVSGTGFSTYLASPPAIGGTTAAAGSFTTLSATGNVTLSGGTANGVLYLNGSKVATSGSGLVFDSSGNLGLGVTPSGWGSGIKALQIGTGSSLINAGASGDAYLGQNVYYNGTNNIYITTSAASQYALASGVHKWFTAPSGTAGNAITFTQAMTLDASGNLLIGGTTTPSGGKANNFVNLGGSGGFWTKSGGVGYFGTFDNYAMVFATNDTERARITSGGSFCVHDGTVVDLALVTFAKTTETSPVLVIKNPQYSCDMWSTNTSGDNVWVRFFSETSATQRGSIAYNRAGGLVAYNTTSDYRAKDIIGPVTDTGTTIDALKVYNGKMKGATVERPMLVAHEAQEVTPYAVTGEKDAVNENGDPIFQQMDMSSFVPLLIAELQSLRQRVAQLEGTQP